MSKYRLIDILQYFYSFSSRRTRLQERLQLPRTLLRKESNSFIQILYQMRNEDNITGRMEGTMLYMKYGRSFVTSSQHGKTLSFVRDLRGLRRPPGTISKLCSKHYS